MKISKIKKQKICEQILSILYSNSPKLLFTSQIAYEIARDEEFVKKLLEDLFVKKLVDKITKNPKGKNYKRRIRWKLSEKAYLHYKSKQSF